MNILFLSDIHFGREAYFPDECKNREKILRELIHTLKYLPEALKPHYILVTGDIAWTGASEEYGDAYNFFQEILDVTGLSGRHISMCVGNHDVNRKVIVHPEEKEIIDEKGNFNITRIDELYRYENVDEFARQIQNY